MKHLLVIYFKFCKNNIFLIVSNGFGKVLLNLNAGCLGFKNSKKTSIDVFYMMLNHTVKFVFNQSKSKYIFLKLDNINYFFLKNLYQFFIKKLQTAKKIILGFKTINNISHNGCKKKK